MLNIHFYLFSCIQDQLSHFIVYISLCIIREKCSKYVIKIYQTKIMKTKKLFIRNELNQFFSWKRALHFSKRTPSFDKVALE